MTMEDSHIAHLDIAEGVSLFGVFDGHGGAEVAKFCKAYFLEELLQNQAFKDKNYQKALEENFLKMDEILFTAEGQKKLKKFHNEKEQMVSMAGCTANVVIVTPEQYYIANAGDARSVLWKKPGDMVSLSKDHKPDLPEEKERITKAGGYVSEGRVNDNLNLSRAIGDLEYKKNKQFEPQDQIISAFPDVVIHQRDLVNDNFIIIGCDGIWELYTGKDICGMIQTKIAENKPLDKVCEETLDQLIAKETQEGLGCDNMSMCLIKFKN